jgi:hypothetical protein
MPETRRFPPPPSEDNMTPDRPTSLEEAQAMLRAAIPGIVKSMRQVATDTNTSATERLKAVELLMRVISGPVGRPAEQTDIDAGREAHTAVLEAVPLVEAIGRSHKSARLRSKALKLANRIDGLKG